MNHRPAPLGTRLREHLGDAARQFESADPGVEVIMERGTARRRRNTTLMVAAASFAIVGTLVVAIGFVRDHRSSEDLRPGSTDEPGQRLEGLSGTVSIDLPDAQQGDTGIVWDAVAPVNGLSSVGAWYDTTFTGAGVYALGTAPSVNWQQSRQRVFQTSDGVEFDATSEALTDRWISNLASSGDTLYSLGTSPAKGGGWEYVASTSVDGGNTWADAPLPIDVASIRSELGGAGWYGNQLATGNDVAVAIVSPAALVGMGSPVPGSVDAPFGGTLTDEGFAVYGEPTAAELTASSCTSGWTATQEPKFSQVTRDTGPAMVATTMVFDRPGGGGGGVQPWFCETEGRDPVMIDPAAWHGAIDHVVPFSELGLSRDSLLALLHRPRLFRTTSTEPWTEVELPEGIALVPSLGSPARLIWTGDHFTLLLTAADGSHLFTSPDGTTWTAGEFPDELDRPALTALPDGSLLAIGHAGGNLAAFTSADGTTWSGVNLGGVLGLDPTWRISQARVASGPVGTALMVTAMRDNLAAAGGYTIDHERLHLTMTDQMGGMRLTDSSGKVLDEIVAWQGGFYGVPRPGRMLQMTNMGDIQVVDPVTGERIDQFSSAEVNEAWNRISSRAENNGQPQPSDSWVLDTVDGVTWASTRLGPMGLSGTNVNGRYTFATEDTLAFGFGVYSMTNGTSTAVTVVGRRA